MKYALVISEIPENPPLDRQQALRSYEEYCKDISVNNESVTMLNPYTFLFELNAGMYPLSNLLARAESWSVTTRVLFFENEPLWIVSE